MLIDYYKFIWGNLFFVVAKNAWRFDPVNTRWKAEQVFNRESNDDVF